ncbi:major facilitator superfamily domain-containing protein [Roridomyces roridus]|uniref:Major facilitator superfamily domain-containing protein n=1 Tax=Roridomyces roridus TaxID=1738132 RepID=A0AAD7BU51_9AGAR|nr:major facilitator superfamily domain-containing protein [Roridomyces roridus]
MTKRDSDSSIETLAVAARDEAKDSLSVQTSRPASTDLEAPPSSILTASSATLHQFSEACPQLSTARLVATHIGAALTLFLATTDATIVSTSLPTIASDLNMTKNEYSWVGIAYMLTQTALQPLYGRISDLVGRKVVLFWSMLIFSLGSLICGLAQNISMLLAGRAIAGIGAGGIVGCVWVITAELVEVRHRAKWSQALSITWSCSAIAGPVFGGLFSGSHGSGNVSWRYGFFLNLPVGFVAFVVLFASLRDVQLGKASNASWRSFIQTFDFGGLFLFMTGSGFIVVGFSLASQNGWTAASTLLLICFGTAILLGGGVYETRTKRECLFPAATFRDRRTMVILAITFFHNVAFNAGTFYLALFYQTVNGSTPLQAGLKSLPYSLGSSLASMPAAWFMNYWQRHTNNTGGQNWIISIGLLIATLGFGLLNMLNQRSSITAELFPLIAGIGLGMLFHAPYQVFIRTLAQRDLAAGTSAFFLVRFTGATVGLAVAGAVFDARAYSRMPPALVLNGGASIDFLRLRNLQPPELQQQVLHILATSIQVRILLRGQVQADIWTCRLFGPFVHHAWGFPSSSHWCSFAQRHKA